MSERKKFDEIKKKSDDLKNFTFWTNIFTVCTHPTVITNTVSIIFATPCKVFTFANLITILTIVAAEKKKTSSINSEFKSLKIRFDLTYPSGQGTLHDVPVQPGAH